MFRVRPQRRLSQLLQLAYSQSVGSLSWSIGTVTIDRPAMFTSIADSLVSLVFLYTHVSAQVKVVTTDQRYLSS